VPNPWLTGNFTFCRKDDIGALGAAHIEADRIFRSPRAEPEAAGELPPAAMARGRQPRLRTFREVLGRHHARRRMNQQHIFSLLSRSARPLSEVRSVLVAPLLVLRPVFGDGRFREAFSCSKISAICAEIEIGVPGSSRSECRACRVRLAVRE